IELGIQRNVLFHNRYVPLEDLCEYLQAADLYAAPDAGKEQIASGTLAYAVASGRAVISTPYWHAQELLCDGRGRVADFGDVDGFAYHLRDLLSNRGIREKIRRAAYDFGREMVWPRVAQHYKETFAEARSSFEKSSPKPIEQRVLRAASLPAQVVTPSISTTEAALAETAG
ncbi:MAG: glycosyltransferase, partial [Planctomycetes bacterium]|nr:glycosyltransferase [Planctomycetota bacterium]